MNNIRGFTKLVLLSLILSVIVLNISARGCVRRSSSKNGSSGNNSFTINAPSNLTATAVSPYQIDISWQDNSNNEDGFEVGRKMWVSGEWQILATLGVNSNSYSDSGLVSLTQYYYRVRAFNTIGDRSNWSNEANATTPSLVWTNISVGEAHNIGRTNDGRIWVWGLNDFFQLGLNDTYNRSVPTPQGTDIDWQDIATGRDHSVCMKTSGILWAWGSNAAGELGLGDTLDGSIPYQVGDDSDWYVVKGGGIEYYDPAGTTIAIKSDRTLWAWGFNGFGQLGFGDTIFTSTPGLLGTDPDWSIVAVGSLHVLGLKTNGMLWSWGFNDRGQLGNGGASRLTPGQTGTDSDWSTLTAGAYHSLGVKNNKSLWSWGKNETGQLGLGFTNWGVDIPTQIGSDLDWSTVSAGIIYTIALKTNSTMWAWGNNECGYLGLGDIFLRDTPAQIGTDANWSFISAGGVGIAENGVPPYGYHTMAIKTDGSLWAWGYNRYGQLGIGTTTDVLTPTQTGSFLPNPPVFLVATVISSMQINLSWIDLAYNESRFEIERSIATNTNYSLFAIVGADVMLYLDTPISSNTVYYYRVRAYNPLGYSAYSNEAVAIAGYWKEIAAGYNNCLGVRNNGTLWAWGVNDYGQLGLGDSGGISFRRRTPTQVGTISDWASVVIGGDGFGAHTIARKSNGSIWSWGANDVGQLGLNDTVNRLTPVQIDNASDWSYIATGDYHTIAIKQNKTLWGWGYNGDGELGLGYTDDKMIPTKIGEESNWEKIAVGSYHTIAIKNNKTLWAWGGGSGTLFNYGQLGLGDTIDRWTPTQIGTFSDWYWIAAGQFHSLASKTDGTLWAWGKDDRCQLGDGGYPFPRTTPEQIGTDSDWSIVSAGAIHSFAIKTNTSLWAWGDAGNGRLGLGNIAIFSPTPVQIGADTSMGIIPDGTIGWSKICGGLAHSIALKNTGTIWSWGANAGGQLGLGLTGDRNTPTLVGE